MISKEEKTNVPNRFGNKDTLSKLLEADCIYYLKRQNHYLEHHLKALKLLKEKVEEIRKT